MEIRKIRGWVYLLTLGYSLDIYARGDQRKGVERGSGWETLNYTFKKQV